MVEFLQSIPAIEFPNQPPLIIGKGTGAGTGVEVAVPLNVISVVAPVDELEEMRRVVDFAPSDVGENVTLTAQLAPADTVGVRVVHVPAETVNIPVSPPVFVIELTTREPTPTLLIVTVLAVDVVPTSTLPKLDDVGLTEM